MQPYEHYATLGLDHDCSPAQIRDAFRLLAKQLHPDVNARSSAQMQKVNAAYEILSETNSRKKYDAECVAAKTTVARSHPGKLQKNISQEAQLRIEDFLRGTTLEVRVDDPGNLQGREVYELAIPPETAPGTRFKISRAGPFAGGFIVVRVKARADFRFKVRGSDLRCDLKISFQRAVSGGVESVRGVTGNNLRVSIPKKAARGEIITLPGEGLPKARGGRGDLLVRLQYRPEVRIVRRPR